ncbi:PREDICTED: plant intracellular Ras-group-related LRR protein 6-like [Populus euphratica]|uniref:Plant intracellular Ras-group-related LRR protein 6-like n=1 Tax=Populus euphratica TaxID=75702 RepID=A0AAJ6XDG1_POPEU|nr:PREDICTED: plant intracellular Ras-group-related LRR protein 6-like [Populus euphratica]
MMYEQIQQQQQQQMMNRVDRRKVMGERRKAIEEEEVDLSGMSLETIPNPSLNLAAICKLNLSNNDLQMIPESLTARMLNLVVLDVHSNQLKSLPNSIGCLSKLKVLNVSCNLLVSLPRTIENCRKDVRKILKRKDSDAGERGRALEELRSSLFSRFHLSESTKRQQLCGLVIALTFNFLVAIGIIFMNK